MAQSVLEAEKSNLPGSSRNPPLGSSIRSAVPETEVTASKPDSKHKEPAVVRSGSVPSFAAETPGSCLLANPSEVQEDDDFDRLVAEVQETADLVNPCVEGTLYSSMLTT